MGGGEARGTRAGWLREFLEFVEERLKDVEGIIIFGSVAKGQEGIWSDVDVMVVSDDFKGMPIPDRIGILLEGARGRIEPLGYTYEELARMVRRANPLALGALVEGRFLKASERLLELAERASRAYTRVGRVWVPRDRKACRGT